MYRLVADPFLQRGWATAIVGYRTYPDGTAQDQRDDCEQALQKLIMEYPDWCQTGRVTIIGHSSGAVQAHGNDCVILVLRLARVFELCFLVLARRFSLSHTHPAVMILCLRTTGAHVALLLLVSWIEKDGSRVGNNSDAIIPSPLGVVDSYVGLSGPYDISHHFDFEAARGVEELSPMKVSCGISRQGFHRHSPAHRLRSFLADYSNEPIESIQRFPQMLLLHGIDDGTVPFTATADAARALRQCGVAHCQELYVADTGHQDTVVQLMVGGPTRKHVVDWIVGLDECSSSDRSDDSSSRQHGNCNSSSSSDRRMVAASKL
jgi:hypothetical protein